MKISHLAILLLATTGMVVATVDVPSLRGDHQLVETDEGDPFVLARLLGDWLDEEDFEVLRAEYNAGKNDNKCKFRFQKSKNDSSKTIKFDKVEESDGGCKVTCSDEVSPSNGVDEDVEADLDTDDVKWVDKDGDEQDVTYAKVEWDKSSEKIKLTIKRKKCGSDSDEEPTDIDDLKKLEAKYDEGKGKATLKYRLEGGTKTVTFKGSQCTEKDSGNGRRVNCQRDKGPEGGVVLPIETTDEDDFTKLTWIDEDDDKQTVKRVSLKWKENEEITLKLEIDKTSSSDKEIKVKSAKYNPENGKAEFKYKVGSSSTTYKVKFGKDDCEERSGGDKVKCTEHEMPEKDGELPVREDIDDAKWGDDDADDADVKWKEDGEIILKIEK